MQKSKLYLLIQTLEERELETIAYTIRSNPALLKQHRVVSLFQYLVTHRHVPEKVDRIVVHAHLFGTEQAFDDLTLRRLTSDTLAMVEQTWVICHQQSMLTSSSEADAFTPLLCLMELYRSKQLLKHYQNVRERLQKRLAVCRHLSAEYYLQYSHFWGNPTDFSDHRNHSSKQAHLAQASDNLDVYYFAKKLKMAAEMLVLQKVAATKHHVQSLEWVLLELQHHSQWLAYPIVALYYHNFMALKEPENIVHFEQLIALFSTQHQTLPQEEAREMYYFLLNYCVDKINNNDAAYLLRIIDLYGLGLTTRLIFEEQYLSAWHYKNMITASLRAHQLDWAREVLHRYSPYLRKEQYANAYNYNLANYYFFAKQFDNVLIHLQQVGYDEVFYGLDARTLQLKTYYELKEYEVLLSLADSFWQWLNRASDLSKQRQETYRNFVYFARKLVGLEGILDKMMLLKTAKIWYQKINDTVLVADKQWLLGKITQFNE